MSERQRRARKLLFELLAILPQDLVDEIVAEMQALLAQLDAVEATIRNNALPRADRVAALRRLVEIVLRGD
jgi:hypothetical protein